MTRAPVTPEPTGIHHTAQVLPGDVASRRSSPMTPNPSTVVDDSTPRVHVLLDGALVAVRPLTPADKDAERAFIAGLSNETCRFRFRGTIRDPSEQWLDQLTHVDPAHGRAFAAVVADEHQREELVGISRYSTDPDRVHCECAVVVADGWQHRGLGTLLMRHLIEVARGNGIRWMRSVDSAANIGMWELATYLGFHTRRNPDDASEVIHELALS